MTNITLEFNHRYEDAVPEDAVFPGIYVVYAYNGNRASPTWVLLDIGQADDIYHRHLSHERRPRWLEYAHEHNMRLIIYAARITNENNHRSIAEAALLFRFQPLIPADGRSGYHYGDVTITVTGNLQNAFGTFVLHNTDPN